MMRIFDFTIALLGLLLLAPLFFLSAAIVKISSPGPVFYDQERVGRYGRLFRLYKFRTMVDTAEQMGTSVTTGDDPRITRFGKFLRKTKLDELPQIWNVLKGDMSFVGPRPDVPDIVNNYSSEMMKILNVRPGITSNATLNLRNEEDLLSLAKYPDRAYEEIFIPAKVKLAMEHVTRNSFFFDVGILLRTIWALTCGRILSQKEDTFVYDIKDKIARMNNLSAETPNDNPQQEVT